MFGGPDEQLREALARAMVSLAQSDPVELNSIMDAESLSESKWMSALVLRAWSANPGFYGERMVRFLLDRSEQRLNIGYTFGMGETDLFVAVSRTAVAAASSVCSDESFAELENAILRFTPDWEQKNRQVGRTRLALLRALAQERIGQTAHRQIQELERRFPDAPERGAPQPTTQRIVRSRGWAPQFQQTLCRTCRMTNWLSAMAEYASDRSNHA